MNYISNKYEKIYYILQNESAFGILIVIILYGSQNLHNLSNYLKKKPNSLIYHIKRLIEKNLIEIDVSQKNLPGKYYKLTGEAVEIFNTDFTASFDEIEKEISKLQEEKRTDPLVISKLAISMSGVISLAKIMSTLFILNFEEPENLVLKEGKLFNKDKPLGTAQIFIEILDIEDEEDDKKILRVIKNYTQELNELSKSIEKKHANKNSRGNKSSEIFGNSKKFRFIYQFSSIFRREIDSDMPKIR
ncbi:MAG: hypothetical protein ACFFD1_07045 [Candidatus Thorarchaeota archaeon]